MLNVGGNTFVFLGYFVLGYYFAPVIEYDRRMLTFPLKMFFFCVFFFAGYYGAPAIEYDRRNATQTSYVGPTQPPPPSARDMPLVGTVGRYDDVTYDA